MKSAASTAMSSQDAPRTTAAADAEGRIALGSAADPMRAVVSPMETAVMPGKICARAAMKAAFWGRLFNVFMSPRL